MAPALLEFLDVFFIVFHALWTLFNAVGFIWKRTRQAHLVAILLTAISWFGLGLVYGLGYCFCTDWHWQVRFRLGKHDMPDSYVSFLLRELTGATPPEAVVDAAVLVVFLLALGAALWLRLREKRLRGGAG